MPRKTDGIPFILQTRPTKGPDGKPLLYAQVEPGHKLTLDHLDIEFQGVGSYRQGDVKRMFEVFANVVGKYVAEGYRIETPLGSFAPKLKTTGAYTDPVQVSNASAGYAGVEFTPSRAFTKQIRKYYRGCLKVSNRVGNSQMRDETAMKRAFRECLVGSTFITLRAFCCHSHLKYWSAKRYLDSLCEGDDALLDRQKNGSLLLYIPKDKDAFNEWVTST